MAPPGEAGESTRHVHHPCVFRALRSESTRAAWPEEPLKQDQRGEPVSAQRRNST